MPLQAITISDDLKQAFWRLALNGNPHWVKYYSSPGQPRGTNDKQASLGYLKDQRDTRRESSKPYFYTSDVVDDRRLGFGFWSRSGETENPTYRFAAFDIEPLDYSKDQRVNRNPSVYEARAAIKEALQITKAVIGLAKSRTDIVWVLLVETSHSHYHVWALFEQPVCEAVHHQFAREVLEAAGPITNLDKSTMRAAGQFGDQMRAPWSWRRQRRTEAVYSYLPDEELVLHLAREARPRTATGSRLVCAPSSSNLGRLLVPGIASELNGNERKSSDGQPGQPEALQPVVDYLREQFPILGPGMRNSVQCKLIARLVNKGVDDPRIIQMGSAWLTSYQESIGTPLPEAIKLLERCLAQTRANPKFANRTSLRDYRQLHKQALLTAQDEAFLSGKIFMRDGQQLLLPADASNMPEAKYA